MCSKCSRCGEEKDDVDRRFSYGFYAGMYCDKCAYEAYADHCGLVKKADGTYAEEGEQGAVEELAEFEAGGYDAIEGEDVWSEPGYIE